MFLIRFLCFKFDFDDIDLYMRTICGLVLGEGRLDVMQVNLTRIEGARGRKY